MRAFQGDFEEILGGTDPPPGMLHVRFSFGAILSVPSTVTATNHSVSETVYDLRITLLLLLRKGHVTEADYL